MSIIIFIILLAVLILVHEFGHFIIAKLSGIRVDEFGLGFPPKIFSFKYGETKYSLNLIPFGGFVKIFGEDPNEESIRGKDSKRSFVKKSKWIQVAVLIAGVSFNVIFAWLLISVGYMSGLPSSVGEFNAGVVRDAHVVVTSVQPNSPALESGLKSGDALLFMESQRGDVIQNFSVEDVQQFIGSHGDEEITILYKRGNDTATIKVRPSYELLPGKPAIGIAMDYIGFAKLPFFRAFYEGAKLTIGLTKAVAVGLGNFIFEAFTGRAELSQVTGPVGIAGLVGDATKLGIIYLLSFAAFISINLAVINLMPFPALDGGRILFVLIETVIRRPIPPKIANAFNTVGFLLLIGLMLLVTYQDILKLF